MKKDKIHIGEIVERAFYQSGMSKAEFARAIGSHNQNLNREFGNSDWSVLKLIAAGVALNFDFSYLFAVGDNAMQKPRVVLQLEVDDDKVTEVLRLVSGSNRISEILDK